MQLNPQSKFIATLLDNDERTGYLKGKIFYPKGVYWHKKNVIIVGDVKSDDVVRLSFPAGSVQVEVQE